MMNKADCNIVFMGTPDFAAESLKALFVAGYNIAGVVTSVDKPAGRGQKLRESAVKKYAVEKGLKIFQPEKLRNPGFLKEINDLNPDIFVVAAFRMLPEQLWKMPSKGTFNLHASLLPQYRGAAPVNWAIINNEKESGVTTFFIDDKIDTGKIIFSEKVRISPDETAGELHDKLMRVGSELVIKTVDAIIQDKIKPMPQNQLEQEAGPLKPAPKIFKEDCRVDWTKTVDEVYNLIRGLSPYPAAFSTFIDEAGKNIQMKLYRTEKERNAEMSGPGKAESDGKTFIRVACADGYLYLKELQMEGKKRMDVESFLRGYPFPAATSFL